jgi:hypothetical protein
VADPLFGVSSIARRSDTKFPRQRVSPSTRMNDRYRDMLKRLFLPLLLVLAFAPAAQAAGGRYVFDGGTRAERGQVTSALNASSFDWSLVPGQTVIHIGKGSSPHAVAGQIWLDGGLLDSGRFSWGVVQHEYAHQVDFALLNDAMRAQLESPLQAGSWWGSISQHAQLGCERFADELAWAYWQSPDNVMKPDSATAEGGQMSPAAFRATLTSVLGREPVRRIASIQGTTPPRKG